MPAHTFHVIASAVLLSLLWGWMLWTYARRTRKAHQAALAKHNADLAALRSAVNHNADLAAEQTLLHAQAEGLPCDPAPRIPGRNHVELFEIAGSDLGIALSAWTSTSRTLTREKIARVPALLARLLRDGHHTPFEKSYLRFLVLVDDATHIHILKHRIAVPVNGESARYKELTDDAFYIPQDWPQEEQDAYAAHARAAFAAYHQTLARLEAAGLSRKRAKESARYYLPKGLQITLDISFNWRSFLHFLRLRLSDHAQKEVREVAAEMLRQVEASGRFPVTCRLARAYLALYAKIDAATQALNLLGPLPASLAFFYDPKPDASLEDVLPDGPTPHQGHAPHQEEPKP